MKAIELINYELENRPRNPRNTTLVLELKDYAYNLEIERATNGFLQEDKNGDIFVNQRAHPSNRSIDDFNKMYIDATNFIRFKWV